MYVRAPTAFSVVPADITVTGGVGTCGADYGSILRSSPLALDRYAFRTPSLCNVALEAAFMHDGAFTTLAGALRHHLDVVTSLRSYDPAAQALPADLSGSIGPTAPLLAALDPLLRDADSAHAGRTRRSCRFRAQRTPRPGAASDKLHKLVPDVVPSGNRTLSFEFADKDRRP